MVSLKEMRVYIECNANATVSELLLDIFWVGPGDSGKSGSGFRWCVRGETNADKYK